MSERTGGKALDTVTAFLRRFVDIEATELRAVLWSFAYFFSVLCSYYIIRPLRDEMGVTYEQAGGSLAHLFTAVFLVMLAAVPVFGWVVSNFPRKRVAPVVYLFFVANLAVFWLLLKAVPGRSTAAAFFVWVSVFNLFAVSLFWSVMSDLWTNAEAKRLYGFIAAGGSIGAFTGPIITQSLVHVVGTANLLILSALLLLVAIGCIQGLRSLLAAPRGDSDETPRNGSIMDGMKQVAADPYLRQIALWAMFSSLIATFLFFERNRIIGAALTVQADRVQLFARTDIITNAITILVQLLVTGAFIKRLGVGLSLAALPATACIALAAVAISPTLWVIVLVSVALRAIGYAIANPGIRVLYTVVDPADKYRAQNFNDTVVVRASDAGTGWIVTGLGKALGLATSSLALVTIPFAAAWLLVSLRLGRLQEDRAGAAEMAEKR